jgi:hypothetical protein
MNVVVYENIKDHKVSNSILQYSNLFIKNGMVMKNRYGKLSHVFEPEIFEDEEMIVIRIKKNKEEM